MELSVSQKETKLVQSRQQCLSLGKTMRHENGGTSNTEENKIQKFVVENPPCKIS
jgi:hypothetical protein